MSMNEPPPKGMGEAAFILAFTLISRLKFKGILDTEDIRVMIEESTLALEEQGLLGDPDARSAHALLEMMMRVHLGLGPPPGFDSGVGTDQ